MSFSSEVKAELCKCDIGSRACTIAEAFGILLYCNTFSDKEIKIITGSEDLTQLLPKLFKRVFGVEFDAVKGEKTAGKRSFVITDKDKLRCILNTFGYDSEKILAHHINLGVLEEEGCRESFVRGAFLAGGSVTDPAKRYHLEFVTDHFQVSREMTALFMDMGFEPKSTSRGGNYITYFKQSAYIEDVLTMIGAPISAMGIMSVKIEKSMTNVINRQVNCDTANVLKTVMASGEQLEAIKRIRDCMAFDSLPDKLRETAILRENNPELSLTDLGKLCDPPLTKSCLNHRIRKIMEISSKLQ